MAQQCATGTYLCATPRGARSIFGGWTVTLSIKTQSTRLHPPIDKIKSCSKYQLHVMMLSFIRSNWIERRDQRSYSQFSPLPGTNWIFPRHHLLNGCSSNILDHGWSRQTRPNLFTLIHYYTQMYMTIGHWPYIWNVYTSRAPSLTSWWPLEHPLT